MTGPAPAPRRSHYCFDRALGELVRCPHITGDGGFCRDPNRSAEQAYEPCPRLTANAPAERGP